MTRTRHPQPLSDARRSSDPHGSVTSRLPHEVARDVPQSEGWARYQTVAPESRTATPTGGHDEARALLALRRALVRTRHERRTLRRAVTQARAELAAGDGVTRARMALAEAERTLEAARAAEERAAGREALVAWLRAREIAEMASAGASGAGPEVREHVLNAMRADDARRALIQTACQTGAAGLVALVFVALGMGAHWLWLLAFVTAGPAGYFGWRAETEWRHLRHLRDSVAASERRMVEREALSRVCRRLGSAPEEMARLEERLRAVGVPIPASLDAGRAVLTRWPASEEPRAAVTAALQAAIGLVERRRALLEVALARLAEARRAREDAAPEAKVSELERRLAEREARLAALAERARALGVAARPGALAAAYGAALARRVGAEN